LWPLLEPHATSPPFFLFPLKSHVIKVPPREKAFSASQKVCARSPSPSRPPPPSAADGVSHARQPRRRLLLPGHAHSLSLFFCLSRPAPFPVDFGSGSLSLLPGVAVAAGAPLVNPARPRMNPVDVLFCAVSRLLAPSWQRQREASNLFWNSKITSFPSSLEWGGKVLPAIVEISSFRFRLRCKILPFRRLLSLLDGQAKPKRNAAAEFRFGGGGGKSFEPRAEAPFPSPVSPSSASICIRANCRRRPRPRRRALARRRCSGETEGKESSKGGKKANSLCNENGKSPP